MNNKAKNSQSKINPSKWRLVIVPTFVDEDPQLNPERWWHRRRENQSLNHF